MNLSGGIRRVYTVAAVCWVALMIVIGISDSNPNVEALVASAVLVPAVSYLFLFVIIPWIWRGFRSPR